MTRFSARAAGFAVCALVLCLAIFVPDRAWALFYDYSNSDPYNGPASRSDWGALVGSMGDVLLPQDIPDGTYTIDAATTSTMCWIFPTASDCSARYHDGDWGHCTLQVSGDTMTVYLYISQAYTHVYWGTASEAAALTDSTGTDASAYISGSPDTGYVPHFFVFNIPALNWQMDLATYGGNEQLGFESGQWWSRVIVFKATQEIYDAIDEASGRPPAPDGGEPAPPDYDEVIDEIIDEADRIDERTDGIDGNPSNGEGGNGYDEIIEQLDGMTDDQANNGGGSTGNSSTESSTSSGDSAGATATEQNASGGSASTTRYQSGRAYEIDPVTFDQLMQEGGGSTEKTFDKATDEEEGSTATRLLGLVVFGVLVLGALARVTIFLASKRT